MSRTRQYPVEKPHPDSARIAGISAAIALNAALLMLLLRPIALPPAGTEPDPVQPFHWIDLVKPKPVDIVPVAKPHPVVPTHAATIPQRQPPVITRQSNAMSTKADTQSIDIKPDPLPPQIIGPPANPTPIEASLAYRDASPPPYPRDALREGIEGIVQLRVLV
jgi:protein TonB